MTTRDMRNASNEYEINKLGTALRRLRHSHPTTGPQRLAQQYNLTDSQSKSIVEDSDDDERLHLSSSNGTVVNYTAIRISPDYFIKNLDYKKRLSGRDHSYIFPIDELSDSRSLLLSSSNGTISKCSGFLKSDKFLENKKVTSVSTPPRLIFSDIMEPQYASHFFGQWGRRSGNHKKVSNGDFEVTLPKIVWEKRLKTKEDYVKRKWSISGS